ncbi:MAG: hypothetical protein JSS49_30045 [Planctomycetes bacterium]|nr:hypothetical protein [Planctomycetota bacterium]
MMGFHWDSSGPLWKSTIGTDWKCALWNAWVWIVIVVTALLWIKSGLAHLANPYAFLASVNRYEIAGMESGWLIALFLPYMQLVLAACLVGKVLFRGSVLLSAALLFCFAMTKASVLWRGLQISCGCFGAAHSDVVNFLSVIVTLAQSLALISIQWRRRKSESHQRITSISGADCNIGPAGHALQ